ncbi:hypothetical protein SAMN05421858_2533 [Haladaptatus litoreus]|uniref:Uncharacterized protein n=1 Tax=Haladaptatus litoreus TaxID=553468 RepID=A0A1N7BFP1_9EURY|nr:hypothetical protein [Haladaptatus litoreus]SIR50209.1 hypothetical protein SAMN05421858_2533 [Haladaptatus litoreus]
MQSPQEKTVPVVDILEIAGLFLLPTLGFGLAVAPLGSGENLTVGLFVGAMFGAMFGAILMSMRRVFYAVRTENGIERRQRTYSSDPDENPWVRAANIEYDEKYDRILAAVLAVVGIAAFAAIPMLNPDGFGVVRLTLLGLFGIVTSLFIFAAPRP